MIRSLNSGVTGIQQFQERLDVIANNIANVNTTAFKSARVNFADSFSQTLRTSAAGGASASGQAALQVGTGVNTAAIQNLFGQGDISRTGNATDLAISGQGFFTVRDVISGSTFATRAGEFHTDSNGYIVTDKGMRAQGYANVGLTTQGDLKIDATGAPSTAAVGATVASYAIDQTGKINVRLSDGSEFVRGQLLLQNFSDPQVLTKEGDNLYSGMSSAGPLPTPLSPGTSGLGKLEAGALELSNVDLANEFATLITTQRAFQANTRIITTSDEVLQELVNLKR
ncbi:MAG: Flagellar basal-body rod protein FlgG [Verrucomicrobiota bacterium]|jgi:flagellar hook protein FlgE